jgi:hypothetical protein
VTAAATVVLLVSPACHAGARRARRLAAELPGARARLISTPPRCPPDQELGARALGLAVGMEVRASLPRVEREAAELGAGRWPRGRRAPLARSIAALAEGLR